MSFATDADLLAYEPDVFIDLPFATQRCLRINDAALSGATVSSATGGFEALAPDDVLVIGVGTTHPVTATIESIDDDNTLTLAAAPIGVTATAGLSVEARTFGPQSSLVHEELLRAIGVDPDDPSPEFDADDVVSVALMRRLEVIGTLARAYAAAITVGGANDAFEQKATDYRQRFARAVRGARILIDADGDGEPDFYRTPGVGRLVRG